MSNRGGHLKASKSYFRTEGPVEISRGGVFYNLKGVVDVNVKDEETGELVPSTTTKLTKGRWHTIYYPHDYYIYSIVGYCLGIQPSPELLDKGQVRTPGLLEAGEKLHIKFRPDMNTNIDEIDCHMRLLLMEPVG